MDHFDVAIVGAGIVGLAIGERLAHRFPDRSIIILEKRPDVGLAQSGRNSGVVHSGIYYKPGSIKAETCRQGKALLESFCARHGVDIETRGKLIVATNTREETQLETLAQCAQANAVDTRRLSGEEAREIEPHVQCRSALHVPGAGVVDFARVCRALARNIESRGGKIVLNTESFRAHEEPTHVVIETAQGQIGAGQLIACAGMGSDRFARASKLEPHVRIIPFKGRYCVLRPESAHLCKGLIYPVPDPRFPFLGAHFTRRIDHSVEVGPTAAPALSRAEGRPLVADAWSTLTDLALWRLALRFARTGAEELWAGASTRALAGKLQRLVPEVRARDLLPTQAGIRAQALRPDGTLVDDFLFAQTPRMLHVCNAPSPAATASLAIAETVINRLPHHPGI